MMINRLVAAVMFAAVASVMSGCANYGPGTKAFDNLSNRTIYGYVQRVSHGPSGDLVKAYCKEADQRKVAEALCDTPDLMDVSNVKVGRNSWEVVGILVASPKSAKVDDGDIIVFRYPTATRLYSQFERIAAKEAESDAKQCGWFGSKIAFAGGVKCEGWSYDKDFLAYDR